MLENIRKSYAEAAGYILDYKKKTVEELADGYCEATDMGNTLDRDGYFAALMLRFWGRVEKIHYACQTVPGFDREEAASLLAKCIIEALGYRAWKDPAKNTNAGSCINQLINSRGAPAVLYESNRAKSCGLLNQVSLNAPVSADGDCELTLEDTIEDAEGNTVERAAADSIAKSFVQNCISNNKVIEAIIFDTIAFNDTVDTEKKVVTKELADGTKLKQNICSSKFSERKCIALLSSLPDNYADYFKGKYCISEKKLAAALEVVRAANNTKLYRQVRAAIANAKESFAN